jgi:hypothetical protein
MGCDNPLISVFNTPAPSFLGGDEMGALKKILNMVLEAIDDGL